LGGETPATGKRGQAARGERRKTIVVSCRVCGATLLSGIDRKLGRCADCPSTLDEELFDRLKDWRGRTASAASVPAYVVFTDATLTALAERRPTDNAGLLAIAGIGARKLEMYGEQVLAMLRSVPTKKDLATER